MARYLSMAEHMARYAAPFRLTHIGFLPLGLAGLLLLQGAVSTPSAASSPLFVRSPMPTAQATGDSQLPAALGDRLLRFIAQTTGAPASSLQILEAGPAIWPDPCVGIPDPLELCAAVETPGWRVEVTDGVMTRIYRTDATGQVIRPERQVADVDEFPRLTARRVLDEIIRTSGLPLEQLDIVAAERQVWDGCFGLASSDQLCTQIAIMGWRVIVTAPDHVWVYHTNQDGTDIRRNDTASQLGNATLVPGFVSEAASPPADDQDETALFTVITSGGFAGQTYKTVLRLDGSVVRYALTGNADPSPTAVGTLSEAGLAQFVQLLQAMQLERLQGLRYPTPPGTADSITVTLMPGRYRVIQYDDTTMAQLPLALQQFHARWHDLMA